MRAFRLIKRNIGYIVAGATRNATTLVETSITDNIGLITLNDPARLNALTVEMGDAFLVAVDQMIAAAKQQQVRAVVVTGKGDAFSAGGDLNWLTERHSTAPFLNSSIMVDFYNRFLSVRKIPVPTICAINGSAIGAGMCMTLACDMRIAASNAKLGFTFSKLGIHPGMGASLLLPRLVPQEYATWLLLTGSIITGMEAQSKGLVLATAEKGKTLEAALDLAKSVAINSPISVQGCVLTLRSNKFEGLESGLLREADTQAIAYVSKDFLRGIDAVKAKKSPIFEGWVK